MGRPTVRQLMLLVLISLIAAPVSARDRPSPPWLAIPDLSTSGGANATVVMTAIDPLTVDDDDFLRNRNPATWQGLGVKRIAFREGAMGWRVWRIVNRARPAGPLWVITHDDENATFAAALEGLRSWGGVMMMIDANARDTSYAARFNRDVASGQQVDPNRNFTESTPVYTGAILRDRLALARPIIALHANAAGADPALPRCPGEPRAKGGSGDISIALCTARMTARRAVLPTWPFDDDDTLALVPHLARSADPTSGFCSRPLARDDFNLVYERVAYSDGSLSNYAAQHGFDYINFETRDRGNSPAGIAEARDRLVTMVDRAMERCAPISGLALRPAPVADRKR